MDIALWDLPYATFIQRALKSSFGSGVTVHIIEPEECAKAIVAGAVDVALVPTVSALKNADIFDVFPAFAVSSWAYPYARLVMPNGFENLSKSIRVPASNPQEAFLAAVVMQEHYGVRVQTIVEGFEPSSTNAGSAAAAGSDEINRLVVGPSVIEVNGLDLGQEWYELSNYPMVWGVFAALKGNATPHLIRGMADAAAIAERLRQEDLASLDDETAEFFAANLRFRFDDLATASITELTQYLYYYQGNDEINDLEVVHLPVDEADAEEHPLL